MNNNPNVKALIDSLFSDHVSSGYPQLVEFAKVFFDYLETENKSGYYQNTLYYQRDIRKQDPEFLEYIRRELGLYSGRLQAADPKIFYDYLVDIWRSKGTEESLKAFFKLFLNDEISVVYPWESVLIPSDGRWIVDNIIRAVAVTGDPYDFVGKKIFQVGSSASAIVDSVSRIKYPNIEVYEFKLLPSSVFGQFADEGNIFVDDTLVASINRIVTGLEIVDGGSNYQVGELITIPQISEITFEAYVSKINDSGSIIEVAINDFGFSNTPLNTIEPGELYYIKDFNIDYVQYEFTVNEADLFVIGYPFSGSNGEVKVYYENNFIRNIIQPNPINEDCQFGFAAELGYSANRIVVSAPEEKSVSGSYDEKDYIVEGATYVYNIDGEFIAKLEATTEDSLVSNPVFTGPFDWVENGSYGSTVAISSLSDNRIVIGQPINNALNSSSALRYSGFIYLYDLDGQLITKVSSPEANTVNAKDYFGAFVAVNDGIIAAGAPQRSEGGVSKSGAAYLFDTDGTLISKIASPNPGVNDYFGGSFVSSENCISIGSNLVAVIQPDTFDTDYNAYTRPNAGGVNYSLRGVVYFYDYSGNYVGKLLYPEEAVDLIETDESVWFGFGVQIKDNRIYVAVRGSVDGPISDYGRVMIFDTSFNYIDSYETSLNVGLFGTVVTNPVSIIVTENTIVTNTTRSLSSLGPIINTYVVDRQTYEPIGNIFVPYATVEITSDDVFVNTENGTGAEFLINYGAVGQYTGRYEGVKGQLSESIVLQDSRYYQKYSYEIRTTIPTDSWLNQYKKTIHPAGMELVPNVITFNYINMGIVNVTETTTLELPDAIESTETITVTEDSIVFEQDYFDEFYFVKDYIGTTYA